MNNVCYSPMMERTLLDSFTSTLSHGCKVVTVKNLFPRVNRQSARHKNHPIHLFKHPWTQGTLNKKDIVSWTGSAMNYFVYEVDRTQHNFEKA